MGHIHVCDAYAAPCDDPESQLDLASWTFQGPEKSRRPTQHETRSFDVMVYDVYTGGNLLCIMQHFQARISTYGFHISGILFGATLFI